MKTVNNIEKSIRVKRIHIDVYGNKTMLGDGKTYKEDIHGKCVD